jgi:mRNA-degrading endonuclease RelE of RelBE toxin-antitoxin system
MENEQQSSLIFLTPEYQQNLGTLSKRFRNIRSDLQPIIEELQQGKILGDRISGLSEEYVVYKLRVRNSNIQKGKSAGYRLIYQLESPTSILLLTIYSKSDREDITANEIKDIIVNSSAQ